MLRSCCGVLFFCLALLVFPYGTAFSEPLKFYGNADLPPILSVVNGRQEGIVVDVFAEVSRRTDSDITLELLDWNEAQARVRAGQGTGLVQLNKNAERATYLDFSVPLLTSEFLIFHRRADVHLQDLDALSGKTVGVESGGFPKSLIQDRSDINRRTLDSWEEGFRLLEQGQIDAVIVDRWVGEYVLARAGMSGIVSSVRPLATLVSHIAVVKEQAAVLREVDRALEEMRADGTFDSIVSKWRFSEIVYITERENLLNQLVFGLLVVVVVAALVLAIVIHRLWKTRRQLSEERALLETRVAERTDALRQQAETELRLRRQAQEAEQKAVDLAQAKTSLLATMSHELRTPLNAVIGYSEVLESRAEDGLEADTVQQYSRVIGMSGRDLLTLINDILDYAKIGDDRFELFDAPFNLGVEASNVRSIFQLRAKEAGVTLTTDFPADALTLNGDAMRFRQVMHNLVDNALKFSKGGNVHLEVRREMLENQRCQVTVRVTDDGIGIPKDRQKMIFEPFTQQDSSITREFGGTGLGLSISKSLAQIMGGDLTVSSTPGTGSTFTATFVFEDFSKVSAAVVELHGGPSYGAVPTLGLDVMAVDDVEENLDVLGLMLEQLGCTLHRFSDPHAALEWSRNNKVDVVLMDIHMPEMDGAETASRIKADAPPYRGTPFFAWTADVGVMRRSDTRKVEWDGVIRKPTTRQDLILSLRELVNAGTNVHRIA